MWLISFGSHVVVRREGEASICLPFCVCMCVLMCLCTLNVSRPAGHPSVGLSGVISTIFLFPAHTCTHFAPRTPLDTHCIYRHHEQTLDKKHRHLTCRHLTHTHKTSPWVRLRFLPVLQLYHLAVQPIRTHAHKHTHYSHKSIACIDRPLRNKTVRMENHCWVDNSFTDWLRKHAAARACASQIVTQKLITRGRKIKVREERKRKKEGQIMENRWLKAEGTKEKKRRLD